jgi:hypothetical protein
VLKKYVVKNKEDKYWSGRFWKTSIYEAKFYSDIEDVEASDKWSILEVEIKIKEVRE